MLRRIIFGEYYTTCSVGIVTDYGLDGPGSNPGGGRDFPPVQTGPGAHPTSCKMGAGTFLGVKCGRGLLLTIHPLLVPRSWKSRAHLYTPSGPHRACNGITLLYITILTHTTLVQEKFILNKIIYKFSFICSTVTFNISRHICGARHPL